MNTRLTAFLAALCFLAGAPPGIDSSPATAFLAPRAGHGAAEAASESPNCASLLVRIGAALEPHNGDTDGPALQQALARDTRTVASTDSACVPLIQEKLAVAPTCGHAFDAVAEAFVGAATVSPARSAALLKGAPAACRVALLRSLQRAADVDAELARLVHTVAISTRDPDETEAAWLALGSLAKTARGLGRIGIAQKIDGALAAELAIPRGHRVEILEAAGNSGCESCIPAVGDALRSQDPGVRRAAAAAHRFLPVVAAVNAMCDRLERDDDDMVREEAAWSLRWRDDFIEPRVNCLIASAARDPASAVRVAAVRSIAWLSAKSGYAADALLHLSLEAYSDDVRQVAMANLLRDHTDADERVALLP